jgi:hypothetical protein
MKCFKTLADRYPDGPEFLDGLVRGHADLGIAFENLRDPRNAAAEYGASIEIAKKLVSAHPEVVDFHHNLGMVSAYLARVRHNEGREEEAVTAWQQAVEHARIVCDRTSGAKPYRQVLAGEYAGLTISLRALGRGAEAVAAARQLQPMALGDFAILYDAACALALCIPVVSADQQSALAGEAMDALRAAVAAGFANPTHMTRDPDLDPLRNRDDFRRLLAELEDRTFPADPFAP